MKVKDQGVVSKVPIPTFFNYSFKIYKDLEFALDYLCRATGRDIFVVLPEKIEDRIPYLIKEIKITVKEFD